MDAEYAQGYRDLYSRHWWFRSRAEFVLDTLDRFVDHAPAGRVLDIGCGDGLSLPALSAFGTPEGLEVEASIVSEETHARWKVHVCGFDDGFDPGRTYNLVTMLDVLEHLDDRPERVRHVWRLLEPGGVFLATVPASHALWTQHDVLNHHRLRYTRGGLRTEIARAGFEILELRHFFHWLAPVKLAIRVAEHFRTSSPAPPSVPVGAINDLAYRLSKIEQSTWGRAGLPFGSSLVAVARRPVGELG